MFWVSIGLKENNLLSLMTSETYSINLIEKGSFEKVHALPLLETLTPTQSDMNPRSYFRMHSIHAQKFGISISGFIGTIFLNAPPRANLGLPDFKMQCEKTACFWLRLRFYDLFIWNEKQLSFSICLIYMYLKVKSTATSHQEGAGSEDFCSLCSLCAWNIFSR